MSGDEAEIHIPKAWGQGRMERKRHNSFSLDIWNYGSEIFTGASNIPAQPGSLGFSSRVSQDAVIGYNYDQLLGSQLEKGPDIPPANLGFSSGRTVSKNENQSKPYVLPQLRDAPTQTVSHNAASRIPSATPHQVHQSSERKSSLFQDSSAIPQINPFAYAQRLSFAKIGGTSRNRPNMERRASDSDQLSSSWKGEGFCWRKKDSPIGIFIWGFPFELKVYNLLDNFSGFGEIRNSKL